MKVKYAQHVVSMLDGRILPPGALWISGYLDDASEAVKTLKRHAARKRREAQRKLASEKPAPKRLTKSKRSR